MSKAFQSSAAAKEVDDDDNPAEALYKHDRTDDRSPQHRRLDAIARLVNGEEICTAVYFDGGQFLIANNSGTPTELMTKYFQFFKATAKKKSEDPEWRKQRYARGKELVYASLAKATDPKTRVAKIRQMIHKLQNKTPLTQYDQATLREAKSTMRTKDAKEAFEKIIPDNDTSPFIDDAASLAILYKYYDALVQKNVTELAARLQKDVIKVIDSIIGSPPESAFGDSIMDTLKLEKNFRVVGAAKDPVHAVEDRTPRL